MSIERLKTMKDCFMTAVESQMYNLAEVDAEELGEVVDMIKDLSEAVYYCSIAEAMEKSEKQGGSEQMYYSPDRMYYRGQPRDSNGRFTSYYSDGGNNSNGSNGGSSSSYYGGSNGRSSNGGGSSSSGSSSSGNSGSSQYSEREFPGAFQDPREGRSPRSRRMYMEAKETKQDKTTQMRELEKYMQELAQDIIEMVEDASFEEKQYLGKKVSALSTKLNKLTSTGYD